MSGRTARGVFGLVEKTNQYHPVVQGNGGRSNGGKKNKKLRKRGKEKANSRKQETANKAFSVGLPGEDHQQTKEGRGKRTSSSRGGMERWKVKNNHAK